MSEDEIIFPDFTRPHLEVVERDRSGCQHGRVLVDAVLRVVKCTVCDVVLDPVEVLLRYAHKEKRFSYSASSAKTMLGQTRDKIRELKAEEKRIKSRVRYSKKKQAETCEVREGCRLVKGLEEANYELRRRIMTMSREIK